MTPDDKRAIEAAATNAGMTTSEYVRACTLMMMVLDLDPHAVRALGQGLTSAVRQKLKRLVGSIAWGKSV